MFIVLFVNANWNEAKIESVSNVKKKLGETKMRCPDNKCNGGLEQLESDFNCIVCRDCHKEYELKEKKQ